MLQNMKETDKAQNMKETDRTEIHSLSNNNVICHLGSWLEGSEGRLVDVILSLHKMLNLKELLEPRYGASRNCS